MSDPEESADSHAEESPDEPDVPDLSGALDVVERYLLGASPSLTRVEVAERAGVPLGLAEQLWRLMGFVHHHDDEVAFTPADVRALELSRDLADLGVLTADRQAALVRTWGRSFARLAEWQSSLLTAIALESEDDPAQTLAALAEDVLPRVEELQSYVWRRHLASAGNRMLAVESPGTPLLRQAVVFVDIVGYTSRSKTLSEAELVEWLEYFENQTLDLVVDRGGRIIKNIGDEVLLVCDDPVAAVEVALEMVRRGQDEEDTFPEVRAGLAYGDVINRLGDVFGPTVNIAARLTSVARPGTVVVDEGAQEALNDVRAGPGLRGLRRMRRVCR